MSESENNISNERKIMVGKGKLYKKNKVNTALDEVLKSNSVEETKQIVKESGYYVGDLISKIGLYESFYTTEEIQTLNDKLKEYKDYTSTIRNENIKRYYKKQKDSSIEKIEEIMQNFIDGEIEGIESFCKENNITITSFYNYIDVLRSSNRKLYEKCLKKYESVNLINKEKDKEELNEIAMLIKTPIEENGLVRKFDILDYFNSTTISIDRAIRIAIKYLSPTNASTVKNFLKSKIDADKTNEKDINVIFNEVRIIDAKEDAKGNYIEGSGRLITKEEKENIIKYLEKNELPINIYTYNAAFKRYVEGFLVFKNGKVLVKKKDSNS